MFVVQKDSFCVNVCGEEGFILGNVCGAEGLLSR